MIQNEKDSYSLFIVVIKQSCSAQEEIESWEIALIAVIASVIGLAIIFLLIVLLVPKLREKIFPFKSTNKKIRDL